MNPTETDKQKIRRYLNGSYLKEEAEELHQALAGASLSTLDELSDEVWNDQEVESHLTPMAEKQAYREAQQILHRSRFQKRTLYKRAIYAVSGIAAAILVAVAGIQLYGYHQKASVVYNQVTTSYGEQKKVMLADGSHIVLNACSSLKYPNKFIHKERKVMLQGEAFFQIARNEKKPFRVETEDLSVKVLGTEFNVKAYQNDEQVSVDVQSGKVEVTLPEATLRLKKQERIQVNTESGEFNKKQETEQKVAIWREGNFGFHNTPIQDVARELERTFHCQITFAPGQEFKNVLSGELSSKSLESVLESISYVTGIQHRKEKNHIILYKEKHVKP